MGSRKARVARFPPPRPPARGGDRWDVCRTRASRAPEGAADSRREWPSVVAVPLGAHQAGTLWGGTTWSSAEGRRPRWSVGPGGCRIVCACTCVCMCLCACVCMSVRACTYVYPCTSVCPCVWMYLCMCTCVPVYVWMGLCVPMYTHRYAHVYVPMYVR